MSLNLKANQEWVCRPEFKLINEIAQFSCDADGQLHLDDSQKKYLRLPQRGPRGYWLKLKQGFNPDLVQEKEHEKGLDYLLNWTIATLESVESKKFDSLKSLYGGAEVMTHYKALQFVGESPYNEQEYQYDIVATKYKGVIFLCHIETEKELERKRESSEPFQISTYAGRKFERLMTSTDQYGHYSCALRQIEPGENFNIVSVYQLDDHKIFIGCGVDCFEPKTGERVELRTHKNFRVDTPQEGAFKMFKCRHIWLNLYLTGTEKVVFGLKDRHFIVHDLMPLKTSEIPDYITNSDGESPWKPAVCMDAIDQFLHFAKKQMDGAEDLQYFRFTFGPEIGQISLAAEITDNHRFLNDRFLAATMDIP